MKCTKGCCKLRTWTSPILWEDDWGFNFRKRAGVILIYKRNVLLVQSYGGNWGFPKGAVESGESDEDAASRELLEETGIFISPKHIKEYGHRLNSTNGVLFTIILSEKVEPNLVVVRKNKKNDTTGIGWVNIECIIKTENLPSNIYLRRFRVMVSRCGIDEWIAKYTTNTELQLKS